MLSHPKRGDVPIRDVKTMENCFSWTSQQNSQTANPTGMLSTMLKHLVTSKEPGILHRDSVNNKRGDVLVKWVRTINECFKGNSRQINRVKNNWECYTQCGNISISLI
jgi:hypothetical protein